LIAITDFDIYEWDDRESIMMGRGTGDRVGVFSFYRYDQNLLTKPKIVCLDVFYYYVLTNRKLIGNITPMERAV
jgi:hypothetical protein